MVIVQAMSMLLWGFLSNSLADKNCLFSTVAFQNHRIFLINKEFFDNFTTRLILDFRGSLKMSAFFFKFKHEIM
jgi:hypothetical protein